MGHLGLLTQDTDFSSRGNRAFRLGKGSPFRGHGTRIPMIRSLRPRGGLVVFLDLVWGSLNWGGPAMGIQSDAIVACPG